MDAKDWLLLRILEEDSTQEVSEVADLTGLSEAEVQDRVRAMEDEKIIRGYCASIDWEKAGEGVAAATVNLKVTPERDVGYDRIAERIARFPQVCSLRLISGEYDFELRVTGRNIQDITRFVSEQVAPMEQIRETATILVMKTYKENGRILYDRKEGERLPFSF
ncbi:Lrp/AsnC family transcriptional regulator [Methanogenium sp. S4BF]|uniref:Lrp/AsnC family transcriptional regulator n=1 Tax=Methanogenium sp. S4BF TaxID=1789226 RepID=UPI002415BD32|nr:Lrp/AsnC family transcriptional regulator [Methanogenium sp. S4BF]WFN34058.1 Lrp/AsnC family transcriptional regulator [Methanogenium sp. S4BF]